MHCTRAAIVEYVVGTTPFAVNESEVPEELAVVATVEARLVRKLLAVEPTSERWPDVVAAPLLDAGTIPVFTERETFRPDNSVLREWHAHVNGRREIVRRWEPVVTSLASTVPRKNLEALVEEYVAEEERRLSRFGQQVEQLLRLPSDPAGLSRCREVAAKLAQWVDAPAMEETAEQFFRLSTRIEENGAAMRGELREKYEALPAKAVERIRAEAASGYCLPEKQYAFLDDTLFVFDGQFAPDEMRMLMAEYLADLRKRMEKAAIALDWKRDRTLAERPGDIPERVRALVWRRDQGRCVVCRATTDLEFDHIIPRSLGGASTVQNVQVLCSRCNARKGAQVARLFARAENAASSETLNLFHQARGENDR